VKVDICTPSPQVFEQEPVGANKPTQLTGTQFCELHGVEMVSPFAVEHGNPPLAAGVVIMKTEV
jgi:hypothetical protein